MATLEIFDEEDRPTEQWELGGRPLTVGRGDAADVKIDDDGLSRRHFTIMREGGEFVIRDLSSRNGTWVEGSRRTSTILHDGDAILAGRTRFRFCEQNLHSEVTMRRLTGPNDTVVIPELSV
jgi:pSer/pThr/pTyr-binding forkhead associated (FHA) protein